MIILIALGLVIRLLMLLSGKSLWGDEFFSIVLCQKPYLDVVLGSIQDVHPPLYFLVLSTFVKLFGPLEPVLRLPSFLFGLGSVFLIKMLATRLYCRKIGIWAMVLAFLSPYLLQQANEVRGYAMFGFLSVLSTYLFIRYVEDGIRWRWAYLPAIGATIYTEHYGWFVLISHLFYLEKRERLRKLPIALIGFPSGALIVYQAIYGEGVFKLYRLLEYLREDWMFKKVGGIFWHFIAGYEVSMLSWENLMRLFSRIDRYDFYSLMLNSLMLNILCVFLGMMFFVKGFLKSTLPIRRLAIWMIFVPIGLLLLYPIRLDARYLAFSFPLFLAILARGTHA